MTFAPSGKFDPALPTGVVAFRSWRAMKTWVAVWLWYLNFIYWVAFFYLSHNEAHWAALSYVAVGPLIFFLIIRQRGLSRLSGLIHLPWLPFAAYLALRLFSDFLGPRLTPDADAFYYYWLQIVFWSTALCLAFDVVDVARWLGGDRDIIGSPAAAAKGASKLAKQTL